MPVARPARGTVPGTGGAQGVAPLQTPRPREKHAARRLLQGGWSGRGWKAEMAAWLGAPGLQLARGEDGEEKALDSPQPHCLQPQVTDGGMEALRGKVTCPGHRGRSQVELGLGPCPPPDSCPPATHPSKETSPPPGSLLWSRLAVVSAIPVPVPWPGAYQAWP